MTTTVTEEWAQADSALARVLGFRIIRQPGHEVSPVTVQFLEWDAEDKMSITAQQPVSEWQADLWDELVRSRIDGNAACKLAWDLYSAAMGVSIQSFNGMPAGEPAEVIRQERRRLLKIIHDLGGEATP